MLDRGKSIGDKKIGKILEKDSSCVILLGKLTNRLAKLKKSPDGSGIPPGQSDTFNLRGTTCQSRSIPCRKSDLHLPTIPNWLVSTGLVNCGRA